MTSIFDISISRHFDAPREEVFQQWLDVEAIRDWFAPKGWEGLSASMDPQPGGIWRVEYRSAGNGARFTEFGTIKEISRFDRIVLTLTQVEGATEGPETLITVRFEDGARGGTLMHFHQTGFRSERHRDAVAQGWGTCLDKLDDKLSLQQLQQLHEEWFAASERRDIEASMAPISDDVVSYEHNSPLQYLGVEAVRAVCQEGFDLATGEFRWTVPDLKIVVAGDLAVSWGLNHMAAEANGVPTMDMWSRGTRIFARRDGRWRMIHQHVSFPVDAATGRAAFDAKP